MKNYWHIVMFAAVVWAITACTDDSYRGFEEDYTDYETPLEVHVAVGNPYTKGTGPVDNLSNFANKDILVWAYNRNENTSFTSTRTATDSITCLINERPAMMDGSNSIASWKDGLVYYPGSSNMQAKFDFYAAFIDDAQIDRVERKEDRVILHFDIDGSQDLMTSKAELPRYKESGEVKDYAFSYLAAMDGDEPIFTMRHRLVRLSVYLRQGITKSFENTIEVFNATVNSRVHAVMTAVAKDTSLMGVEFPDPFKDDVLLKEADGSDLVPIDITTLEGNPNDKELIAKQKKDEKLLGASFFVSPEDEYVLQMNLRLKNTKGQNSGEEPDPNDDAAGDGDEPEEGDENGEDGEDGEEQGDEPETGYSYPVKQPVRLKSPEATFLPGHSYRVTLTIYGLYAIYADVSMEEWEPRGGFIIDQQNDGELRELNVSVKDMYLSQGVTQPIDPKILVTNKKGELQDIREIAADGEEDYYDYNSILNSICFSFESLNPEVAPVNDQGVVTAISAGEAVILVTATRTYPDGTVAGMGRAALTVTVTD